MHMKTPTRLDEVVGTYASRRSFFRRLSFAAALFSVPGLFAEELTRKTPWVEEGPFYPPKLPLDTDNDLLIVNDSIAPAVGQITAQVRAEREKPGRSRDVPHRLPEQGVRLIAAFRSGPAVGRGIYHDVFLPSLPRVPRLR